MKTAQDVITDFQRLTPDQKNQVINFVISIHDQSETNFLKKAFEEDYVEKENYSPEDIAELDRIQEEAQQGINMSGPFESTEELFDHLDSLKPE